MAQQMDLGGRVPVLPMDVERMRNRAMELYLRRELRRLEGKMVHLSQTLPPTALQAKGGLWQNEMGRRHEGWDLLLQLRYLEAVRQGIFETLALLQ